LFFSLMDTIEERFQIDLNLMNINYNMLHNEHLRHVSLVLINKFLNKRKSFRFSNKENVSNLQNKIHQIKLLKLVHQI
jgi:hypothetical protein